MKNFGELLFTKAKKINIFIITTIVVMVVGAIIMFPFSDNWKQYTIIPFVIGILFATLLTTLIGGMRVAQDFFDQANELEDLIRDNGDKDIVIRKLYDLKKKSFHKQTSYRLREIAKMVEIKYNIQILKY